MVLYVHQAASVRSGIRRGLLPLLHFKVQCVQRSDADWILFPFSHSVNLRDGCLGEIAGNLQFAEIPALLATVKVT